jgi:WD40 repeat protein/DNA-binding SARP family transcriptional activator
MDFQILGPLEVRSEHGVVALGGSKPRAVLAVLLLHPNEPVSAERLAVALWGEDAPAGAVKTVQVHVSRLRKALGDGAVVTTSAAGYQLRVRPGELDAERFERLVERGRRALAVGQFEEAAEVLRQAEGLWRGPPLADLAFEPFAQAAIARLEEEQMAALEARVEADAAAGRHAELVAELRRLVAEHPTREGLAAQLMLALYRCGRQTEALDAYRDARRRLADEIGVEPGPELRALQEAILNHDPSLESQRSTGELPDELATAAAPELVGRGAELRWLLERWERAVTSAGALVTLAGPDGIGKTRLAAELAAEVHQRGAAVLFASGSGPQESLTGTLDRARAASRATLLVLDDADRARPEAASAIEALAREVARLPVLVVATRGSPDGLASDALTVEPLGVDAVRAIAGHYAPGDALPAERLLEASGGMPRRVHELAVEWARSAATQRVEAVAGRAASGRAELRSIEAELAGGVVALQAVPEQVERAGGNGGPVVCPFKGLASFEAADAPYFFGRERLVAELVAKLVGAPLLGVVGPSGSGKSSVVRAGLLPALASGVLPGSKAWPQAVIRPGEHPLAELERALAGLGTARRVVLAVDQFEETFTFCRHKTERARFIAELARLSQRQEGSAVVLAIRADFYGRCAEYPELSRALAANHVLVGSMRHVELRRAVVGPAERVGLHVEPDLVEALVADVEDEPGALPLLSTALLELWQRRDGRRLRLASYEDTGGVLGAVARLAEDAFGQLDAEQQRLGRRAMLRLAEVELEGGVERRRLPLAELDAGDGSNAATQVIDLLADARLLTVSDGSVEFAHEALLREWPRLREWIEDGRDDMRVHRALSAAGDEWLRMDRDDEALYRGARLAEARDWAARADPGPTASEREFLEASVDRERRERRTHRRHLAFAFGALAIGIVAIAAFALVAVDERGDAERQRNIAVSRQLALESGRALTVDPELATRLALTADATAPTEQAAAALREAALGFRQLAAFRADPIDANTAAYAPDGRRIVTGGSEGIGRIWDVATGREVARVDAGHGAVMAARYAPDGGRIALGFADGAVAVTDPALAAPRELVPDGGSEVNDIAFSGDGRLVAAARDDGTVDILPADGGGPAEAIAGDDGAVLGVDVDADGARVVTAANNGTIRLWQAAGGWSGRVLHSGEPATDVAFSPDGSRVLGVGDDGWARLWSTSGGVEERRVGGEGRALDAAAFSADGDRFAAGGRDGVTRVWSTAGGPPIAELRGQGASVLDVGFGATSDRVVSAGDDGTARIWDAGDGLAWVVPSTAFNIDFSRDGRLIASGSLDGSVRVWDTGAGKLQASAGGPGGYTTGEFSPAKDEILIGSDGRHGVAIWPVPGDEVFQFAEIPKGRGMNVARFDATGDRVVYVDTEGEITVRDFVADREVKFGGGPADVWDAQLSPDGAHLAAVPDQGEVLIWRLDRPAQPERKLEGHRGKVLALAYSRDGRIVTAGGDRTVRVWDPRGGAELVLRGHQDEVSSALFSRDGARILSSSQDGTLRLWDARTGAQLAVLRSNEDELYDVALSADGKIATLGKGEVVRVFPCEVCGSLEQVRALARSRGARPLTAEERERFLAGAG